MKIKRYLETQVKKALGERGGIVVVYGARQVGKTTLLKSIIKESRLEFLYLDCEDINNRRKLTGMGVEGLKRIVRNNKLLVLDEAQKVENIGVTLKLLADHFERLKVLVSGSSSFDLANKINEPATGRKKTFVMYPFSLGELGLGWDERFLRHGMYPKTFALEDEKDVEDYLLEMSGDYLYKDALDYQQVKNSEQVRKLLVALALQIGKEASYTELANTVGVDQKTVIRYVDILEKSFIVFRLSALSRNLRKELNKTRKIYFYDLGIRNAVLKNFNEMELREDAGGLWENFLIIERLKRDATYRERKNYYFWRTYDQQEVDLVEEAGGRLCGFEFKWGKSKVREPKDFLETYKGSKFQVVNRDNFEEFIGV